MGRKSILGRLRSAKAPERQKDILTDWVGSWDAEQTQLIDKLDTAIFLHDFDKACIAVGQLKAVSSKKFEALFNIVDNFGIVIYDLQELHIEQSALIARLGRELANEDWQGLRKTYIKLYSQSKTVIDLIAKSVDNHKFT